MKHPLLDNSDGLEPASARIVHRPELCTCVLNVNKNSGKAYAIEQLPLAIIEGLKFLFLVFIKFKQALA